MKFSPGSSQDRGYAAERAAERYLKTQGLTLVTRNFRGRQGEIDLIMEDGNILVFIEVRSRKSSRFGSAVETIDATKQAKLIKTAHLYLLGDSKPAEKSQQADGRLDRICRFDTVDFDGDIGEQNLRWIKNAFSS
ncbi:MAG: YraN family protein [Immundisolibacteraceae bacterium]|nr:YraN family protein [Immundisolibacteraceae bacterium]